ncbi:aryl-alcohol dehydrogenase-like predicted oxidoreductase [Amycolatopsis sulphurea]|uniref:Aryl-alcohol dehydrogenase-like predicted oxidoreductase n=1 Tax=Amycolatopsis sulphurea TaxID=76022 RepID=A0A2A9FHI1_9PSEU|nr:aldo/keto reductase [Amycolatopsis sulphurea]PFG50608.1 aryl-alcohol dehydrogenase-like predicted oxidoreductase [Amycolatopsis sulphurea]
MKQRTMGRLGWQVGEVGYGMWGIGGGPGGFTGWNYDVAPTALDLAVDLDCTFFDTAWVYGRGTSECLLGELRRRRPDADMRIATKIPPLNREWPPRPQDTLEDVFPAAHILDYTKRSLDNLGVAKIDLLQFHVWEDRWAAEPGWQDAVARLKEDGLIDGFGISVNRWEPENCFAALDTGLIDAIQVIYNVFDQAPEDELFPRALEEDIAIIARVPFDEGSLTGTLTAETAFPAEDWRAVYFGPENLPPTVARVEALRALIPDGITLPELALRFILHHPAVSAVIPGMRRPEHVRANLQVSGADPLPPELLDALRAHRWDRTPTPWSM